MAVVPLANVSETGFAPAAGVALAGDSNGLLVPCAYSDVVFGTEIRIMSRYGSSFMLKMTALKSRNPFWL